LQTVLTNVPMPAGEDYSIVLSGYSGFRGTYRMEFTCSDPIEPTDEPQCSNEIIELQCGDSIQGSTDQSCNGQQQFSFIASTELTTISSCGSDFDTMLALQAPTGQMIAFIDDTHVCDRHAVLENLELNSGNQYMMTLVGYGGVTGTYQIEVTCTDPLEQSPPTAEPTPLVTMIPTLEPTVPATLENAYQPMFGSEPSFTTCSYEFSLGQLCSPNAPCDLDTCVARCDMHADCRFAFANDRGTCFIYRDCSRTRQSTHLGVTMRRLETGEEASTLRPIDESGTTFVDLYGSLDAPSRTTCSYDGRLSTACTRTRSCSTIQCEEHCTNNAECQFFFSNVAGGCMLYRTCDSTRVVRYEGRTLARVN